MNYQYIAVIPLRWGDGFIQPGQAVPLESGRDYDGMERRGEIERLEVEIPQPESAAPSPEPVLETPKLETKPEPVKPSDPSPIAIQARQVPVLDQEGAAVGSRSAKKGR